MVGWSSGWLAACSLLGLASPFLTLCEIETDLDHICPDALAFIAAAIHCFTRPPICYTNHSCAHVSAFDLLCVFVLIGTTWFQSFSASARVYAMYTCLLVWLAACFMHLPFLRFETWAYVSFLFHVLGSAALRSCYPSSYSPTCCVDD